MSSKYIEVPSNAMLLERDIDKSPVLETMHLGIDFGGLNAVDEFNLTIGRTEIVGLIGPNGAGKTTVFNLLTKVYQPTRGTILLNGKETSGMNTVQVNKAGIARTFQNIRLFSALSVEDNVKIGLHNSMNAGMFSGILPAASGDRPGSGHQSQPFAAGRTCRGHEPLGDGGADGEHPQDPGYLPDRRHAHRA